MATLRLPLFTHSQQYKVSEAPTTTNQLHIQPNTATSALGRPATLARRFSRPEHLRTASTPPESPTRARAGTVGAGAGDSKMGLHESGAITPPATPNRVLSQTKDGYIDSRTSRLGTSTCGEILTGTPKKEEAGSTELKAFPYWKTDYVGGGKKDKNKLLGSGLWSDVYLAVPSLPTSTSPSLQTEKTAGSRDSGAVAADVESRTPPITPTCPHTTAPNPSKTHVPSQLPTAYAIKAPTSRSAKKVIDQEAIILSYLSRFPHSEDHIIEFYGQDTRTGALVLKAMDTTLDTWTNKELNALPEAARAEKLSSVFVDIARGLIDGLAWMGQRGCTHSDIKPSNILLSPNSAVTAAPLVSKTPSPPPKCIYADFSSATLSNNDKLRVDPSTNAPPNPLGGGTWDFLDPLLLTKSKSASAAPLSPSPQSDLWALAITLLYLVIGSSPFDCAGTNVFRRREIIKHGSPILYAAYGDEGVRNLRRMDGLGKALGFDVKAWFGMVLLKDGEKRVGIQEWKDVLGRVGGE